MTTVTMVILMLMVFAFSVAGSLVGIMLYYRFFFEEDYNKEFDFADDSADELYMDDEHKFFTNNPISDRK